MAFRFVLTEEAETQVLDILGYVEQKTRQPQFVCGMPSTTPSGNSPRGS